jgi:hypothetical protein
MAKTRLLPPKPQTKATRITSSLRRMSRQSSIRQIEGRTLLDGSIDSGSSFDPFQLVRQPLRPPETRVKFFTDPSDETTEQLQTYYV